MEIKSQSNEEKIVETVEVPAAAGVIKPKDRIKIEYYDHKKEAGGVILGYREDDGRLKPSRFVQLRNTSRDPKLYKLPGFFTMMFVLKGFGAYTKKYRKVRKENRVKWKEVFNGLTIIGEWHTDFFGNMAMSRKDVQVAMKRAKMFGIWLCAVVVQKHGDRGKCLITPFKYNNKTISKKKPRGI